MMHLVVMVSMLVPFVILAAVLPRIAQARPGMIFGLSLLFLLAVTAWLLQRCTSAAAMSAGGTYDSTPGAGWHAGFFYFKPKDAALLVPKRLGVGWTLNFARPLAWICLLTLLALIGFFLKAAHH